MYWAYGKPSKRIEVQIPKGEKWVTVAAAERDGDCMATTIRFQPVRSSKFRLYQPSGCGRADRPNLIWVGEISIGKAE